MIRISSNSRNYFRVVFFGFWMVFSFFWLGGLLDASEKGSIFFLRLVQFFLIWNIYVCASMREIIWRDECIVAETMFSIRKEEIPLSSIERIEDVSSFFDPSWMSGVREYELRYSRPGKTSSSSFSFYVKKDPHSAENLKYLLRALEIDK